MYCRRSPIDHALEWMRSYEHGGNKPPPHQTSNGPYLTTWQHFNTVGFESNLHKNIIRKREKYKNLIKDLKSDYSSVKFINLSMSSLGILSAECSTFQDMLNDIGTDEKQQRYIIRKMINFALELLITYLAAEIRIGIIQNYWNVR